MLASEKNEEFKIVNNDAETSSSNALGINGNPNCIPTENGMESNNDLEKENYSILNNLNGDSDSNEWSSSSEDCLESASSCSLRDRDVNMKNSTVDPHLLNEISSQDGDGSKSLTNCDLNDDISVPNKNLVNKNCTKKVRPLKICFGVRNSINGVKKNSKVEDSPSKEHYIERCASDSDLSEPEAQPEYAQYLGLKPSVKFKCSRCGAKNFATMTLLKEHMASCSGQSLSVTSVPLINSICRNEDASGTNLRITRKVFLCSSCGTYYQSYDLYTHMREIHNKQICLFCFSMFYRSQQLWDHLITTHNLKLGEFTNVSQIRNAFKGSFYITCCTCNRIFSEDERFDEHICQLIDDTQDARSTLVNHTEVSSPVTESIDDGKKLPSLDTDNSPPVSPLSPIVHSPAPSEHDKESIVNEYEEKEESEHKIVEDESIAEKSTVHDDLDSPEQQSSFDDNPEKQSSFDDNPEKQSSFDDNPENDVESNKMEVETPTVPDVPSQESSIASQTLNDVENTETNKVNDLDNRSLKNDSSDSEALNAIFDQATVEEPKQEKISQPLPMALMLDDTVASLSPQTLIKECVRTSCTNCTYCNHSILITVNGKQLAKHLISEHRYKPTKNEDDSEQVAQKIESVIPELEDVYMNASSTEFDGTFVCFQCSFRTTLLKELCAHKRKAHQMNIFLCFVCKCNFYHYSELLCHECPGEYSAEPYSLRFRCCFCSLIHIPSAFRLMIHFRKFHKACDFCLLRFNDQYELFSHMTKQHKMHHLCYKCNLAYRSRNDINKHLFWKHGTESVLCKRCLQKKWPHAYHFCIPASTYACEECNRVFSKAIALTVHRRAHAGEFPFACECDQRFISKRLLAAHQKIVHSISDGKDETLDTSRDSTKTENRGEDFSNNTEQRATDDKKQRKKKRKKTKMNEKPLLDELPPLNLSSESDEESAPDDEAAAKSEQLQIPSKPTSPAFEAVPETPIEEASVEEKPSSPVRDSEPAEQTEQTENTESVHEAEPVETANDKLTDDLLEKALNCLLIEHSYCIPDSIFHSESVEGEEKHRTPDHQMSTSPHKHDGKSCCKSTTPHKRKRAKKNSSGGESSSSASSSDSDSSSSSCGSNCSCNRSNSNCSSSSSASDCSTTPEKKKSKKQKKKDENIDQRTQKQREQIFLLDARESDLDTEISSAGEEFYEERPCFVPPIQNDKKVDDLQVEPETPVVSVDNEPKARSRKDKKKKKKRIKLNLAGRIPPNCNPLMNTNALTPPPTISPVPVPNNEFTNQQLHPPHQYFNEKPLILTNLNATENCINSDAQTDDPNTSRLSKRKRVKNKFYGYSSSDDASRDSAPVKSVPKKRVLTKKSGMPKNRPFVGIRAKQLPPLPKRLSVSVPFTPIPNIHRDTYKPPQPSLPYSYNSYQNRFSSSEDSDSDEKRHTLVINIPPTKEKTNNAFRQQMSDESMSSNSWYSSPRTEVPPSQSTPFTSQLAHSTTHTNSPLKNSEKLYCYCQCPYDEVSEMIGCDAPNCKIEWFHFDCVGIMVPPKGKWYCPSCRRNRENVARYL